MRATGRSGRSSVGSVTQKRLERGRLGEDLAAQKLADAGWRLIERNARTRFGEIDIVALEGEALVFVEVKTGRAGAAVGPPRPVLAVGPDKQRRLRRLGIGWISDRREAGLRLPRFSQIRFDVVGVTVGPDGAVSAYEHLRDAF